MPAIALFCLFFLGSAEVLHAQSLERVRIAYSPGGLISFPLIITKEKKIFQMGQVVDFTIAKQAFEELSKGK